MFVSTTGPVMSAMQAEEIFPGHGLGDEGCGGE
jgi:hypothetical protein